MTQTEIHLNGYKIGVISNLNPFGYKIFEEKAGRPWFMFCALRGSRKVKTDDWLTAENKTVSDGTSHRKYKSGFHVIPDPNNIAAYARKFKNLNNKVVCMVEYRNSRPKPTKGSLASLANEMYVHTEDWATRKPLSEYLGQDSNPQRLR